MQTFKTLNDAIALAEFAHRNQTDKAGLPYIDHPKRVLAKVQAQGALPYVQMAAVLHDVTEDTSFTPDHLLDLGFGEPVVEIVKLVDRNHSAELWDYLDPIDPANKTERDRFYYEQIRKNPGALMVKLADIADNTEPWRLSYFTPETRGRLERKYERAVELLNGVSS